LKKVIYLEDPDFIPDGEEQQEQEQE
jgi:hypothetical protein